MKKLIIGIILCMFATTAYSATSISVLPFITPDDVTIAHLETQRTTFQNFLNSIDGDNIQSSTITPDQLNDNANPVTRWNEAFNDWVYTGLTIPTSASLSTTTTLGTAYISGERIEKAATANTYTASKWTFVDLSDTGTYYYTEVAVGASDPAIAAGRTRIARVSSDGTTIAAVRDDRMLSISLDSSQENFQRSGLLMRVITPDQVIISTGIGYWGTTRFKKASVTSLNLATGGDWFDGARGASTVGYVAINNAGTIQLTSTAPSKVDISGNTVGTLRYIVDSGDSSLWRALGWFYMNATGSGNLTTWGFSNLDDNGTTNAVARSYGELATGTTATPNDDTIAQSNEGDQYMQLEFVPTNTDQLLRIDVWADVGQTATETTMALFRNSETDAITSIVAEQSANWSTPMAITYFVTADSIAVDTFKVRIGADTAGTISFNGAAGARLQGGVMNSGMSITEMN